MTLLFITAIKSEVILSFLGLGVKDSISWGLMIAEASGEVTAGHFCNFFASSGMLFVLVLAFNMFSDSLQDGVGPKEDLICLSKPHCYRWRILRLNLRPIKARFARLTE